MKYKLLKDLPNVKAGTISFERSNLHYFENQGNNPQVYTQNEVKNNPEWFTPMLFITEDKVDIYLGEECFILNTENNHIFENWVYRKDIIDYPNYKYFSTKKAAENYLLLEEAKRKYPIGTKVKDYAYPTVVYEIKKDIIVEREGTIFIDEVIVYHKGKWSKIVVEPKFKVGDFIVKNGYGQVMKLDKVYWRETDWIGESPDCNEKLYLQYVKKATNEEIIKYYQDLGWVKGAKFKAPKPYPFIGIFNNIVLRNNFIGLWLTDDSKKELESVEGWFLDFYSRKFHNNSTASISVNKNLFKTEKQAESTLAFAQLSQLVAEMNGDWQPNWEDDEEKYLIFRDGDILVRETWLKTYSPLPFKSEEARDFSFQHHKELWNKYYQLS